MKIGPLHITWIKEHEHTITIERGKVIELLKAHSPEAKISLSDRTYRQYPYYDIAKFIERNHIKRRAIPEVFDCDDFCLQFLAKFNLAFPGIPAFYADMYPEKSGAGHRMIIFLDSMNKVHLYDATNRMLGKGLFKNYTIKTIK